MKRSDDDTRTMDWLIWSGGYTTLSGSVPLLPLVLVFVPWLVVVVVYCYRNGIRANIDISSWWHAVDATIIYGATNTKEKEEFRLWCCTRTSNTQNHSSGGSSAANAENISRAAIAIAQIIRNLCHKHEVYQRTKKSMGKRTSSLRLPVKNNYIISKIT